jgi:hypothetical protein
MKMRILIRAALNAEIGPIEGRPGKTQVTVKVMNLSGKPLDGALHMRLPGSWTALTPDIPIAALNPQETRSLICKFAWSAEWKPDESANIELDFGHGLRLARSLIPNQYAIHRAKNITLDGSLDDWGSETQLPHWMLGSTVGESQAEIHLAWAVEGIYGAVVVHDSKLQVRDPRSFWAADSLELFADVNDNKDPRSAAEGDHQFWLVPLPEEKRVYLGQWKMKNEIQATRYDIAAIRGVATRTAGGYAMEFLLPADQVRNFRPQVGRRLGLNVNLTVQSKQNSREVYWPNPKKFGVNTRPDRWGTVLLVD